MQFDKELSVMEVLAGCGRGCGSGRNERLRLVGASVDGAAFSLAQKAYMIVGIRVQSALLVVVRINGIGYGRTVLIPLVCAKDISAIIILVVYSQHIAPALLNDSGRIAHLYVCGIAAATEFGIVE